MRVDIAASGLNYEMSKTSTADEPSLVYMLGLQHHFYKEPKQNKSKLTVLSQNHRLFEAERHHWRFPSPTP